MLLGLTPQTDQRSQGDPHTPPVFSGTLLLQSVLIRRQQELPDRQ